MRVAAAIAFAVTLLAAHPAQRAHAQSCADDAVTIETVRGTVMDIKLAPDPFPSADIYLSGPAPCAAMWMQVLKQDAEKCRVGGAIEVRGVVTSDAENNAWQIGPVDNQYMTFGQDFTCS
ncbi:MAG TPA: hypothetical protein VFW28_18825 [Micropepsaceae bacterium]|nr:hypothetical protein [Micropepsaceae bacterium]